MEIGPATKAAAIAMALVLASSSGCRRSPSETPAPEPAPAPTPPTPAPTDPPLVTGSERLGWDQQLLPGTQAAEYDFAVYVDGMRSALSRVECARETNPREISCTAPLPQLEPGRHVLEMVAIRVVGGQVRESAKSEPLTVRKISLSVTIPVPAADMPEGTASRAASGWQRIQILARGLDTPSDMAFAPDGRLFVAERTGRVRVLEGDALWPEPMLILAGVETRGGLGLFAVAVHPDFLENRYLYLVYSARRTENLSTYRVLRVRDVAGRLTDPVVLFDDTPAESPGWAAMRFGPDRKLYVALADLPHSSRAQDLASYNGKILRLNDDGFVPRDNPFSSPIYSVGHSAVQGLAWNPAGKLWASERRGDGAGYLLQISAGANYGWPPDGRHQPVAGPAVRLWQLADALVPGGIVFSATASHADLGGQLLLADLRRGIQLVRFDGSSNPVPSAFKRITESGLERIRCVVSGPEGAIYFCTNNTPESESTGSTDDRIGRIVPTVQ